LDTGTVTISDRMGGAIASTSISTRCKAALTKVTAGFGKLVKRAHSERNRPMRKPMPSSPAVASMLQARAVAARPLTGALIGTVKDVQGAVLPGAVVRVSSPTVIGGPKILTTNQNRQLRFPALPPGLYELDIEVQGFKAHSELKRSCSTERGRRR
jgi:hypothetical protein